MGLEDEEGEEEEEKEEEEEGEEKGEREELELEQEKEEAVLFAGVVCPYAEYLVAGFVFVCGVLNCVTEMLLVCGEGEVGE